MLKTILVALVSLYLFSNTSDSSLVLHQQDASNSESGILEKLIVANGKVTMNIDLNRFSGSRSKSALKALRFNVAPNSFFPVLVFNKDFRGIEPGSMALVPQNLANLPAPLKASYNQLVIESTSWGQPFELVVRDEKTGFVFFNIEAQEYEYAANEHLLNLNQGRLQLSKEFASELGQPSETGSVVGTITISLVMSPIEITQVVNGEAKSSVMPSISGISPTLVSGPDVIVGDLSGLAQFGSSSGTQVGLAVGTDSCNAGAVPLNWLALPNNDHPVIPQNLYRLSGGTTNDDRFEQVGQSEVKHAFTALQQDICGFGCSATASTTLGSGCSDPYTASLNSGGSSNSLGSRAWINPFTGAYPRGDSATPPNNHAGHTHTGPSHRILVEMSDLNTTLNPGATYFAEAQYVTPHEYAWCQAHPGECNMANNASHRKYTVTGTTSFTFTPVGTTVRSKPAISAWSGATINKIEPDPGNDGIGFVAYKVTHPSPTVWHYEYAVYNQNLDRAIQSFAVPLGAGTNLSNLGFHAPPQHPAWANDGTVGNAGYSSTPWTPTQSTNAITWTSETLAQNPNANAIRWGTLYNFRFDSDRPPQTTNATVGFYKTGAPILVQIQGPDQGPVLPTLSINDVTVTEGNAGTTTANFTVTLSATSLSTVSVQYATADGLATAGSDYVSATGTVNFTPGQTTQPVSITVNGDGLEELNETFFVNLTNPVNATVSDAQGVGTINNDDVLATLPAGFGETQINGLSNPTAMAIHPDGRIFVCEQTGALRVIKNGALLPTPFTTLTVDSSGERGLLGITFDHNYASNRFIYVYYTATTPTIHNRVSRFTAAIANEDIAQVGSEVVLLDLETLGATNHNGGAIHFGPDGKLYIAVGENANSANSQLLSNRLGKMLRINSDGTIPADNPTSFPNIAGSPTGNNRAIWAVGLRNPFTFSFQPGTGRMHINDVGQNTWEEVDLGSAGANYGWPTCEGTCGTAGMTNPIYQYSSADPVNCAITGGAFYNPTTATFPAQYIGKYFFADFCGGWLKTLDPLSPPATGTAPDFATGINAPVDIQVANDGSLYYLARGSNSVFRIQYFGAPTLSINDVSISEGNSGTSVASFTVLLSPASSQTVTVQYATADNTASSGSDYVASSGTVTFLPGQTSQPVNVTINGDTSLEPNETFNVNLSVPTNATIGDGLGVGTIVNDDSAPPPTISINDVAVTEGNSGTTTATFTISLSNTSSQTVSVNYATTGNTATSGSDFVATSGTASIAAGALSTTVNVTVNSDGTTEPNETFFVNLSAPTNATIADGQGVGTINNDDSEPTISINDVAVTEGNNGSVTVATFTVSLSNPSSANIQVNYATANGTATTGPGSDDYTGTSGTVLFAPGQVTNTISVTVLGDTIFEPNETFFVNLSFALSSSISDGQGVGTITNDDPQPTISINDVSASEGNSGTTNQAFTVSLSNASSQTITVNYTTADVSATAGSDYVATSGTLTFQPFIQTQVINVTVHGDTTFEPNETFNVNLSGATNASIGDSQGVGTITNDDTQPTISINDVSASEGNAGTPTEIFTVSLSSASSQTITVNYTTADASATAGSDYLATSGTLTFTPGQQTQSITLTVNGDTTFEPNETFNVNLSGATNASISDSQGVGTITNDDAQPTISINDVSAPEGNAGTTTETFTVSLSNASSQTITVNYTTADSSATAGSDYVTAFGTLTFTPGQLTQTITVTVSGDTTFEPSETFNVNLSGATNSSISDSQGVGTITNDDTQPTISINDVSASEGNAGTNTQTFTVSLSNASSQTITVNYTTADNSATAGSDYVATSGTLTFTPGQLTQSVNVTVNGETMFEPNETFNVNLSGATNATIADNQGVGTITNDDSQPTISINDVSQDEGNAGTAPAVFTVSLSNPSSQTITVSYATANNTATAGTDYVATNGTLTFTPGQTSQSVNVSVNGDILNEDTVTFNVNLTSPTNATITDNQGVGTIVDDDAPILGTEENSQRAIALDDVTFVRDPFTVTNPNYFGADHRSRIIIFPTNLKLAPGLVVTAQAVDSQQTHFALPVEFVGSLPTFPGFTQVVVKLPDGIVNAGDLQVTITVRGKTSNVVLVGVTP